MTKKKIIIIISVILFLAILLICLALKNKKKEEALPTSSNKVASKIQYDSQNSVYYITDKNTGERIAESRDEAGLQIYIDNPDYNPNPFKSESNSNGVYEEKYRGVYDENTGTFVNEVTGEPIMDY